MKQMSYSPSRNVSVLDNKIYKGYEYYILSLGTHPTAYVKLSKNDKFYGYDYDSISEFVDVHGGFTYSKDTLSVAPNESDVWFIGWDYAHFGDFFYDAFPDSSDEKYSTFKILEDVINVVNQLKQYNMG